MTRLTYSQVAVVRARKLTEQGGACALCGEQPVAPCLDHCHTNGHIRGVLCRGCNALLGKLENNRKRYGLGNDLRFAKFCNGVAAYLSRYRFGDVFHPTHKTADEKRLARNAAARKKRATKGNAQ